MKWIKIIFIVVWIFLSIYYSHWDESFHLNYSLTPPSPSHIMGFDPYGRDLLFLQFKSFYNSAQVGVLTTLIIILISFLLGTFSALQNEKYRSNFEKILFFFLSFPSLIIALIISALYGPGWLTLFCALTLGILPFGIQFVYYRTLDLLKEDFILSAWSMGASRAHILKKHLTPYVLPFLLVKTPYFFSKALLAEATLSFLGVGAPLGDTSMGLLFSLSREYLIVAPWIIFSISIPFIFTVYTLMSLSENKT